jgi:type VI secretion system protein ImpA
MELEILLRPLDSGQEPCGSDLIFSAEFDAIREARRFDDPSLAQGEWVTDVKEADWENVIRICEEILTNKSKDLRVAAWLTEARGKIGGLSGLGEGYLLLSRLSETYWDDIHPQPEDGDQEQRTGVFDWLVQQTTHLIREKALTHSKKGHFSLIDQESARTTARNIERNPELAQEFSGASTVSLDAFDAALKDTPKSYMLEGLRNAEQLKAAMAILQSTLGQRMGEHAPAFGSTYDALDDVSRFFRRHGGEVEAAPVAADQIGGAARPATAATGKPPGSDTCQQQSAPAPLHSREQAIRQLQEIAAFFRHSEPHSPVAYLADKAAKWGTMPLHEWLRTVVKDDAALGRMEELLGVEPRQAEQGES